MRNHNHYTRSLVLFYFILQDLPLKLQQSEHKLNKYYTQWLE